MQGLFQSAWMLTARSRVMSWLSQGLSPRQLGFTLALGFAIGCIPLLGVTTGICTLVAIMLRLNMPAIQAANWIAMPVQVMLLIPFLKLGQWLFPGQAISLNRAQMLQHLQAAPWNALVSMSSLFGHALLAWLITAGPAFVLLTLVLTLLLGRVPKLAAAEAGD
jgi:uncharacterized protein (DUF2062 family)